MTTTRTTDTPHNGGSSTRAYRIIMFFLLLDWALGRLVKARAREEVAKYARECAKSWDWVLRAGEYTATHTGPLTRKDMDDS